MNRIATSLFTITLTTVLLAAPFTPRASAWQATTSAPKPATTAAKPATTRKPTTAAAPSAIKLPPGVVPVRGILKTAFALKYQDVKIGTGAVAEPNKLYKVHYTGWLASDGKKFDSSFDHQQPILDKDGKPENDAAGKPKMAEAQPIQFPQGRGRVIPGWDQGFEGMKVGGKRRLFIPYQLAYGAVGRPPIIPAKSDLIFDIELIDVTDMPQGGPGGRPMPRPGAPTPSRPSTTTPAPGAAAPPTGSVPPAAPAPADPGTPKSPLNPQAPAATPKPVDPTAPTVAPNSASPAAPTAPSAPSTPPATPPPASATTTPDKPSQQN